MGLPIGYGFTHDFALCRSAGAVRHFHRLRHAFSVLMVWYLSLTVLQQPPFKRSAVKKETHPPAAGGNFTSEAIAERIHKRNEMERLHPPSLCELWRDKQARLPEFGEDVKKTSGFK